MLTTSVDKLVYIGAPCISEGTGEFVLCSMASRKLGRASSRPPFSIFLFADKLLPSRTTPPPFDATCNYLDRLLNFIDV